MDIGSMDIRSMDGYWIDKWMDKWMDIKWMDIGSMDGY